MYIEDNKIKIGDVPVTKDERQIFLKFIELLKIDHKNTIDFIHKYTNEDDMKHIIVDGFKIDMGLLNDDKNIYIVKNDEYELKNKPSKIKNKNIALVSKKFLNFLMHFTLFINKEYKGETLDIVYYNLKTLFDKGYESIILDSRENKGFLIKPNDEFYTDGDIEETYNFNGENTYLYGYNLNYFIHRIYEEYTIEEKRWFKANNIECEDGRYYDEIYLSNLLFDMSLLPKANENFYKKTI